VRRLLVLLVLLLVAGCARQDETLVLVARPTLTSAQIDAEPLGLLPAGAIATGRLDARALFATSLGPSTTALIARVLPLGRESNFEPSRDVERVYGAFYAMQGADFCAVLQGNFDVVTIERAAEQRAATPSGAPLHRTRYAGRSIYTVSNLGFVVLTPRTILSGDETGLRRALDRLRLGTLDHALAPWMKEVLAEPKASFAVVGELDRQGVAQAVADHLAFFDGAKTLRAFGNFQPPGINIVGSLGYRDHEAAVRGAAALDKLQQVSALASLFTAFAGAATPHLELRTNESEVAFASAVDSTFVQLALSTLASVIRPASTGWLGG